MATITQDLGAVTAYGYAKDAGYTGTEAEFTQLLGDLADTVADLEGLTVSISTLPAGSSATASYSDGVLSLGIPKGDKGDTGNTGATGPAAGFGTVSATVDGNVGTPSVEVSASGPDTAKQFAFAFHNLKGDKGDTGEVSEAELAAAIDKIAIKDTASGPIASFPDGADGIPVKSLVVNVEPVQDLHGYDNPWPAGGGKNKSEFRNAESANRQYFTYSKEQADDIECVGNVTESKFFARFVADVVSGTTYIFYRSVHTVDNVAKSTQIYIYSDELFGTLITSFTIGSSQPSQGTWTATVTGKVVIGIYAPDSKDKSIVFKNFIIVPSTDSPTPWVPYSNICPITGWTGANVVRDGFNVWDEEWEVGNYSTTDGSAGTLTDRIRSKNAISVKPGESYYFNFGASSARIYLYDKSDAYIGQFADAFQASGVKTIPSNCCFVRFNMTPNYGTTYNHDISINYPSTDTDYHAYVGTTIPITWQTEAGTVYGGTLDVTNGVLISRPYYASYNGETLVGPWVSSMDAYTPGGTPTIGAQVVDLGGAETEYTLTPAELTTLLGQNNIWADTGDVEVEYRADTKLYIDKKLAQVLNA